MLRKKFIPAVNVLRYEVGNRRSAIYTSNQQCQSIPTSIQQLKTYNYKQMGNHQKVAYHDRELFYRMLSLIELLL